ncbi:MAG: hypothetical protein AAF447_20645 [Myxococcota bacterium]
MWRILAFVTLSACTGSDAPSTPDPAPLPSCRQRTLRTCDVRQPECQEALVAVLGCLRGRTVRTLPVIEVIDVETARARLEAEFAMDAMTMPEPPFEEEVEVLRALGLIPEGVDLFDAQIESFVTGVAAFYTPDTKVVTILDRGRPLRSDDTVATLLHELVHAAQDEESDLATALDEAESWEEYFQLLSLIEGEATFFELEALLWMQGVGPDAPGVDYSGWERLFVELDAITQEDFDAEPASLLWAAEIAPYHYGTRWQWNRWFAGGDGAVVSAFAGAAPASSAEFMADPFRGGFAAPRRPVACDVPEAPAPFLLADATELGPAVTYAVLRETGAEHLTALAFAELWQGDQLSSYGNASGESLGVWRVQLASEALASDLSLRLSTAGHRSSVRGGLVTAVVGPEAVRDGWRWDAEGPCGPPE